MLLTSIILNGVNAEAIIPDRVARKVLDRIRHR
jgi:hypothetical protein